jgi:hypothetical protein
MSNAPRQAAPILQQNPDLAAESYTRSSIEQVVTVPANGFQGVNIYGQNFYLIDSTGPVQISTDKTGPKVYRKGQGEDFPIELRFKRLEFKNETAADITVRLWAGFGHFVDSRVEILEAYTKIRGSATVSIADGATLTLPGTPTNDLVQRKAIVVSNEDPNSIIRVVDSSGNNCCAIFPQTSVTLPVSGTCGIKNTSGAAVTVSVSEIFYALTP